MSENTMIQEYTELLEGCHMGAGTFQIYLDETSDPKLKTILKEALDTFHHHEKTLTQKLIHLNADPSDEVPLMGVVSEFFEKIKVMMKDPDQIIDVALNAIDMGIQGIDSFHEKHSQLPSEVHHATSDLLEDYKKIYQKLSDYKLTNMPSLK